MIKNHKDPLDTDIVRFTKSLALIAITAIFVKEKGNLTPLSKNMSNIKLAVSGNAYIYLLPLRDEAHHNNIFKFYCLHCSKRHFEHNEIKIYTVQRLLFSERYKKLILFCMA